MLLYNVNRYEKSLRGYLQYLEGTEEIEESEKEKKPKEEGDISDTALGASDIKQLDPLVQEFIHSQV